eukprot:3317776-Rhodomonas_salina.1
MPRQGAVGRTHRQGSSDGAARSSSLPSNPSASVLESDVSCSGWRRWRRSGCASAVRASPPSADVWLAKGAQIVNALRNDGLLPTPSAHRPVRCRTRLGISHGSQRSAVEAYDPP